MPEPRTPLAATHFASAGRASATTLGAQRAAYVSDPVALALLDAMPGPAMVLNGQRQIIVTSRMLREAFGVPDGEALFGLRPGEAVQCVHAHEHASGCGTSSACAHCGAVRAVLDALVSGQPTVREASILTQRPEDGGALDVRVHATPVRVGGEPFIVVGLLDVSGERRRRELERSFFGDLHDTCSGMRGLAELLCGPWHDPEHEQQQKADLRTLSVLAVEQIEAQRELLAAERGELSVHVEDVDLGALLEVSIELHRHHPLARGRSIRLEHGRHCRLHTDPMVLRHVVGHLLRTALAATVPGGAVELRCDVEHEVATFSIHHEGVLTERERALVFHRSVPGTDAGNGVGAYGARLLAEQVLGGSVECMSNDRLGTLLVVMLPRLAADSPAS